jgi:hypothetical protein
METHSERMAKRQHTSDELLRIEVTTPDGKTQCVVIPPHAKVIDLKQKIERDLGVNPLHVNLHVDQERGPLRSHEPLGRLMPAALQIVAIVAFPDIMEVLEAMPRDPTLFLGEPTNSARRWQMPMDPVGVAFVPGLTARDGYVAVITADEVYIFNSTTDEGGHEAPYRYVLEKDPHVRENATCELDLMPFGSLSGIAVTERYVLVTDKYNHRITVLELVVEECWMCSKCHGKVRKVVGIKTQSCFFCNTKKPVDITGASSNCQYILQLKFVRNIGGQHRALMGQDLASRSWSDHGEEDETSYDTRQRCEELCETWESTGGGVLNSPRAPTLMGPLVGGVQHMVAVIDGHRVMQFTILGDFVGILFGSWRPSFDHTRFGLPIAIGTADASHNSLTNPSSMTWLTVSNELAIADTGSHRVIIIDAHGNYTRQFGSKGTSSGRLTFPIHITSDLHGSMMILDFNPWIRVHSHDGKHRLTKFVDRVGFGDKMTAFGDTGRVATIHRGDENLWAEGGVNDRFNQEGSQEHAAPSELVKKYFSELAAPSTRAHGSLSVWNPA